MDLNNLQVNPQNLLNQVYLQEIEQNESRIKLWIQYKEKHEKIIQGLKQLVQELSINCMVPIGKKALLKGKLTHTNEILVCIGDGYFVKYSAEQAIALCNRRIKNSEENLEKLEKEKNFLEMHQMLSANSGVFEKFGDCKDIVEYWDEQKVQNWKDEHRKNEKEYRQKLKNSKNEIVVEEIIDDDFFKRLDELELEEELANELNRLENYEKSHTKEVENVNKNKNVSEDENEVEGEGNDDDNDDDDEDDDDEDDNDDDGEDDDENDDDNDNDNDSETKEELVSEQNEIRSTKNIDDHIDEEKVSLSETKSVETVAVNTTTHEIEKKPEIKLSSGNNSKTSKISGKFEVSIIKEDDIRKTITESHSERYKNKKINLTKLNKSLNLKNEIHSEKSKSSGKRVSFADPPFTNYSDESQGITDDSSENQNLTRESDTDDHVTINFSHSSTESSNYETANNANNINNPSDLYEFFSKPKSILKMTSDINYVHKDMPLIEDAVHEEAKEESDLVTKSTYIAVVQDVQEKNKDSTIIKPVEKINNNRPVSRFKLERAQLRK